MNFCHSADMTIHLYCAFNKQFVTVNYRTVS